MGEVLIPADYARGAGVVVPGDEGVMFGDGQNWKSISWITGEVIKELTLDSEYEWVDDIDASDPENSPWLCHSDESVLIADMDGNVRRYDDTGNLGGEGWLGVSSGELWGAVNPEGVEVIPVMYKQISKINSRLIGWRNDDSDIDCYDENGNLLFSADQMGSSWQNNGKSYFQVKNDGIWEIVDEDGRTVTSKKYQLMTRF